MPGVCRQGDAASCGDTASPCSDNVYANGKGVARLSVDSAGGLILGPGSPTVFVNNSVISVKGDLVAPHGSPPHEAPVMVGGSNDVFSG